MSASKGGIAPAIRYRPIFGGPFGQDGRYVMATMPRIEHQMPRALMGPDELVNLVAACVPCNLSKGDRTALEFLSKA